MEEKDILDAPIDILFFTWLYKLMSEGHAKYNEDNDNIIDLDEFASSWFSVGRDNDTLNGFLGVPKTLIPWFAQIKFKQAVVDFKRNRLFLSCGDEDEEAVTISIKVRNKRLALLWHDNFDVDATKELDFRIFAIKADNSVTVSEKVILNIPLINTDEISRVVKMNIAQESLESVYAEDIKANYEKAYASKYLGVDDGDDDDDFMGI